MAKRSWAKNENEKLRLIRVDPEVHESAKLAAHESLMPLKAWVSMVLKERLQMGIAKQSAETL